MASFMRDVVRSLDMLAVRFEFVNLTPMRDGPLAGQLVRDQVGQDAFVVVHFPPQHAAETVIPTGGIFSLPLFGRVAGPSRLAFRLPDDTDQIPFTLEALLDWSALEASLVPVARIPKGTVFEDSVQAPPIQAPQPTETAIELPYRVILSPHPGGAWIHSVVPVTRTRRTELWHTRLGVTVTRPDGTRVLEDQAEGRYVRAVFAPTVSGFPPGTTSPKPEDRSAIVHLSADFTLRKDGAAYRPEPIEVDRLMLSSRGGWLRARGEWDPPSPHTLRQWHHVTTQGRDHHIRVVKEGLLFPFGHRAAHVEITERVIEESDGKQVAILRSRHFVVILESVKTYEAASFAHQGREMPFARSLRITTVSTPTTPVEIPDSRGAFWVMRETAAPATSPAGAVPVHLIGTDMAGENTDLHAALIFVPQEVLTSDVRDILLGIIARAYQQTEDGPTGPRRRISVGSARVTFAPPADPSTPGDTTLTTESLSFDVQVTGAAPLDQLPFLPSLHGATVRLPAVEQIVGSAKPVQIALSKTFLGAGIDTASNPAQLFAEVTDTALNELKVDLPAERGGALARPNLVVRGLSRTVGPVGGNLDQLSAGIFNPMEFFADGAKLLGAVRLSDLVSSAADFISAQSQMPKVVSRVTPTSVVATFDWEPKVTSDAAAILPLKARPPGISLVLHATLERPLDGSPTRSSVTTSLRDFTFSFLGVLSVHFNALTFRSENGGKPDVSAELASEGLVFEPPLSFLNALRRFIPAGGFSDPPVVDVSPTGVKVGYSLALPPVAVGVFALQNVKLGASLHLPFVDGRASLRFNFAERHDEFLVTVQGLGGGGFFAMALGLDGIEMIEAAIEFGASVSMDFGVASGGVSVMAGVYFRHEVLDAEAVPVKARTKLSAYLRLNGEVEVLGLVSVSIELYMGLDYHTDPERLEGVASLVIKIDLTLFSESVELTVRRTFAKGEGDPTFGDVMTERDWALYAGAFA
jgi:hypothetical protein